MISPLWILIFLLALMFFVSGIVKIMHSKKSEPSASWNWAEDFSTGQVKLIGVVEVVCALGIVVPKLLGHGHYLTSASALGLTLLMGGACFTHLRRHEYDLLAISLVCAILSVVIVFLTSPILTTASNPSVFMAWLNR
ncbi:MAG: DoxX family protein [Bacteroidetes bacterium]|nr:DoxX family protein [Bacteroidota bacterium]